MVRAWHSLSSNRRTAEAGTAEPEESRPKRIVGFGTYDRVRHPRIAVILEGFERLGHDVAELNEPLGFSTAERVRMLRSPWRASALLVRLISRWARLTLQRLGANSPAPDVVVVGYMGHFDVLLARILFPRTLIVLDHLVFASDTALDRGARPGLKVRLLGLLDRAALTAAGVVMLDTDENLGLLPPGMRHKAVVVPVGSEAEWFHAPTRPRPRSAPLRVTFFGTFTPLHGAPVIASALAQLPAGLVDATLIGSGQDWEECRRILGEADVQWREWAEPDDLREIIRDSDVCLGVFGLTPKAGRVVPNKVYQGAAAGCAIVTSATGPQRRAFEDAAIFVEPGNPNALAATLAHLAQRRTEVQRLRATAYELASRAFRPEVVAGFLLNALKIEPKAATHDPETFHPRPVAGTSSPVVYQRDVAI